MSGEREREKKKERKVDHLARPDKVHYFLWISRAILPPAPSSHLLRYLASRRIRITVSFSPSSLLVLRSAPSILRFLLRWFLRGQLPRDRLFTLILILLPAVRLSYELVPSLALSPSPPLPCSFLFLHFFPSSCLAEPFSLSSSTSSLNNCEPAVLLFLLPAPPHSTKGC